MSFCLDRLGTAEYLDYVVCNRAVDDKNLDIRIKDSETHQNELGVLSYFAACCLEAKYHTTPGYRDAVKILYMRTGSDWLSLQEFNILFLNFMMSHTRDIEVSLSEQLVMLNSALMRHDYSERVSGLNS